MFVESQSKAFSVEINISIYTSININHIIFINYQVTFSNFVTKITNISLVFPSSYLLSTFCKFFVF